MTISNNELYFLAFHQSFEAVTRNCTEVCENVWARLLLDKTKTFRFVEPFNGSSSCIRHNNILYVYSKIAFERLEVLKNVELNLDTAGRNYE